MNNKKIGILTLNGYQNYGNVLQNFALQLFLKELGYIPETIWYSPISSNMNKFQKIIVHFKNRDLLRTLIYQVRMKFDKKTKLFENEISKRKNNFKPFCDENINYSKYKLTDDILNDKDFIKNINQEYFSFVVGSDQVWGLNGSAYPEMFFLPFSHKNKRNSFAASFGFSNIPNNKLLKDYKMGLSGMHKISVREYAGKSIVKDVSDREAYVHLDPTLLINQDIWKKIASENNMRQSSKYLLTYFLGKQSKEYKSLVKYISNKLNLKIVNLNSLQSPEMFSISPGQYLSLFQKADYIVTDSFHGTVFSIIFQKKFLVLDRNDSMINMNSRISTLLSRMNLKDRFVNYNDIDDLNSDILSKPSFSEAVRVIDINKRESKEYILNAFKI